MQAIDQEELSCLLCQEVPEKSVLCVTSSQSREECPPAVTHQNTPSQNETHADDVQIDHLPAIQYVRRLYFCLDVKRMFVYYSKIVLGRNRRIEVSAMSGKELCQLIDNLMTNSQKKFWADMALMTQQHFPSKAFAKTYYHHSFRPQNADDEVCDVM
ncbi:Hypothetical_protein [Hexamita inflata]|uniref:Hypothetical_protein n=1 Tax=Hexamita inflata TaxID=28002 RepID=A0AA86Q147_9EUKA|nr:Hypothetical protein HINF_LOCUS37491 [Hexamita inflata]